MAEIEDIQDDAIQMFDASPEGVAAIYTPNGLPPQAITVLQGKFFTGTHHGILARVCTFSLLASDIAEPSEGDTIQVGTELWTVHIDGEQYRPEGSGLIWDVLAFKSAAKRF